LDFSKKSILPKKITTHSKKTGVNFALSQTSIFFHVIQLPLFFFFMKKKEQIIPNSNDLFSRAIFAFQYYIFKWWRE